MISLNLNNLNNFTEASVMFGPIELSRTLQFFDFKNRKIDEIRENRNFHCFFYDLCLKTAAHKNWRSFTCKYCPNFCLDSHFFKENNLTIN